MHKQLPSALGISLDDTWKALPAGVKIDFWLNGARIWNKRMCPMQARERFVRFCSIDFSVALDYKWPRLQRELLEFETDIVCR